VAKGKLKFHGTERDVSFPVKIKLEQGILTAEGAATLDTRDYGLPIYRRFLVFSVNPIVHVRFRVTGRLAAQ
jgi:polyisoprenoid-binding protein YceI